MKEKIQELKFKIEYIFKNKILTFIKENKKSTIFIIILIILSIIVITTLIKNKKIENEIPEEKTEITYYERIPGISGAEVKKKLKEWKSGDNYAILVGTAELMTSLNFAEASYVTYLLKENEIPLTIISNEEKKEYYVKCVNYGNTINSNTIISDGSDKNFYCLTGLLEENMYTDQKIPEENSDDKEYTYLIKKKENPWTEENGINIPDEERFTEYQLFNSNDENIGIIYVATVIQESALEIPEEIKENNDSTENE